MEKILNKSNSNSKRMLSKGNESSIYQDAQSKINSHSKKIYSKGNESSVYDDAQSQISNKLEQNNNNNNPNIKNNKELNLFELKKEFLDRNISSKVQYEEEINTNTKLMNKEKNESNNINSRNNNNENFENEDKENESRYSEPEAGNIDKNQTLFEGASQKGGCCNLPKCIIF